jgi:primary-amine oxidase
MTTLLKKYIGYDCPAYATYLPILYHQGETTFMNKNSICIFEYTADHPLQRHTAAQYVAISRSQYLVVRSVSTVGNYDYTIEYLFYLDGSIEVKVRVSGFVFATAWPASREKSKRENEYGYRVHDAASTSMHDHVLNFKADLDIAGTANTFERVSIEPYKKSCPWYDNDDSMANTMHIVRNPLSSETGLNWAANSGSMFVVLNNDSTNAWGEKRGYRIAPGTGMGTPPHLTIINLTRLGRSAEYAAKDLWVVRQKDTEPRSANPMNYLEPDDPLVDFGKFVDGEDIEQEDL